MPNSVIFVSLFGIRLQVRAFYPYHPRTDKLIAQRNWCAWEA